LTSHNIRQPGAVMIFVYPGEESHAHVARYGSAQQGTFAIEIALNATDLEADAWAAVEAQGGSRGGDASRFEYNCPSELAARAQFPTGIPSPLEGYRQFLSSSAFRDMPTTEPEMRLKPALAFSRMKALPSGGNWMRGDHPSDIVLMHEYLRRSALWAQALNSEKAWPFFNIAALAAPDVPRPDDLFQQWKAHEHETHGHFEFMTQWAIYAYLHWSSAERTAGVAAAELPAPYEPLIRLFERGGAFRRDTAGFVEVGGRVIGAPANGQADYTRLPAWLWLDESTLNWLDTVAEDQP
jgi:hypothetical protein